MKELRQLTCVCSCAHLVLWLMHTGSKSEHFLLSFARSSTRLLEAAGHLWPAVAQCPQGCQDGHSPVYHGVQFLLHTGEALQLGNSEAPGDSLSTTMAVQPTPPDEAPSWNFFSAVSLFRHCLHQDGEASTPDPSASCHHQSRSACTAARRYLSAPAPRLAITLH